MWDNSSENVSKGVLFRCVVVFLVLVTVILVVYQIFHAMGIFDASRESGQEEIAALSEVIEPARMPAEEFAVDDIILYLKQKPGSKVLSLETEDEKYQAEVFLDGPFLVVQFDDPLWGPVGKVTIKPDGTIIPKAMNDFDLPSDAFERLPDILAQTRAALHAGTRFASN